MFLHLVLSCIIVSTMLNENVAYFQETFDDLVDL